MGEIIHLSRERIAITLYTRGLGWSKRRDAENERALAVVVGVVRELGPWYFAVRNTGANREVLAAIGAAGGFTLIAGFLIWTVFEED